jgi:pimeloyl-ACP methyl ester carboxylesterase
MGRERLNEEDATVSLHQVELPGGTIEYEDTGGSGRAVVLCHGLLMDGSVWDLVLHHLDDGLRVVRPVLPLGAHRVPMRPDADLSLRGQAARLGELLDRLKLDDVVLVVSDTGFPLLLAAECHPRVGALVALPCEAFGNIPPGLPGKTVALAAHVPGGVLAATCALRLPFMSRLPFTLGPMSRRPIDRGLVSRWTAPLLRDRAVRRDLVKYARASDFSAIDEASRALSCFDGPAVLLWSRTDRMMPFAHAVAMSRALPRAKLVAFDDGGSLLQIDEPVRVAAEINALALA